MPGVRVVLLLFMSMPVPLFEFVFMFVPVLVSAVVPVAALEGVVAMLPESMVEPVAAPELVAGWFCMVEPPVVSVEGAAPPMAGLPVLLCA